MEIFLNGQSVSTQLKSHTVFQLKYPKSIKHFCVETSKFEHASSTMFQKLTTMIMRMLSKKNSTKLNCFSFDSISICRLCVKQPLFGMEFMIVGETTKSKGEIEQKIKQMGGKLVEKIHENVAAIISNPEEVTKMGAIMEVAKTHGIHVVPETFIDDIKNIDPFELMTMCDLSNWGQDVSILVALQYTFLGHIISFYVIFIFHFSHTSVCQN